MKKILAAAMAAFLLVIVGVGLGPASGQAEDGGTPAPAPAASASAAPAGGADETASPAPGASPSAAPSPEDAGTPAPAASPAPAGAPTRHKKKVATRRKPGCHHRPHWVGYRYQTRRASYHLVLPGTSNPALVRRLLADVATIRPVKGKKKVYEVTFKDAEKHPEMNLEISALVNMGRIAPVFDRAGRPVKGRYQVFPISDEEMEAARQRPAYEALRGVQALRQRQDDLDQAMEGLVGSNGAVPKLQDDIHTLGGRVEDQEGRLEALEIKAGLRKEPGQRAALWRLPSWLKGAGRALAWPVMAFAVVLAIWTIAWLRRSWLRAGRSMVVGSPSPPPGSPGPPPTP